ncbi:Iron-sulfur cluster assembly 1-like [Homarus americanus]|uniref:Iron-sulfur cluster assembly 1 homolog, mitochondrial n=1 Tax=Homarus americanus TaxID=6706 RepID=A0A8J5ML12_HOMAM|nr:Iron-sulfur cluster assembly 1-like [Homarus americanus]
MASVASATVRAVKGRRLIPTRAALVLTQNAVEKVRELLEKNPEAVSVRVIIDKKAQLTLLGTEMDYVKSKLSAEFVFNNPNIKGTCGCGESFSI